MKRDWKRYNGMYPQFGFRVTNDLLHEQVIELQLLFEQTDGETVSASETIRRAIGLAWEDLCKGGKLRRRQDDPERIANGGRRTEPDDGLPTTPVARRAVLEARKRRR